MTDKTSPRQMSLGNPPFVSRQPFIHPSQYVPGLTTADIDRWRLVAGEPINKLARKMIQREVSSLNFQIIPRDLENEDHQEASRYYSAMFGDFRNLTTRTLKSICEIPQGGAWEVGWMDAIFDEGRRGTLSFVKFIDAGTLWPTTDPGHPIVQIDPKQSTRRVWFRDDEIKRILAYPRDEFDRIWWQESPTESSFLAIEALSKIYVYYLKQLQDTPMAGILDLMDFAQEDATKWAENFREMLTGIDPIKIPILYEHEHPARFLALGRNPSEMDIPVQFQRFAEMVLGNYGLSLSDLRMFDVGSTKAGAAVSRKISTQSGVGFFAELIKDAVQSLLPPYLIFTYDDVDIEQKRTKSQIRASDIRAIQSLDWLPPRLKARQLLKWEAIDVEFDPDEIEKEARELMGPTGGMGQAPGALKPGQLETGEGRTRDVLEDDAKTAAADGSRVFAKSLVEQARDLVDNVVSRFKANFSESKYGRKKKAAAVRLEKLMEREFRALGRKVTRSFVGNMMTNIYTQFPDVLTNISTEPMEAKAAIWDMRIAEFSDTHFDHYVEKLDELQIRIEALVDQLLEEAEFFELSDEEFLIRLTDIYALAYEDGLLGAAELLQMELFKRGEAAKPTVTQSFRLTDPVTLSFLERRAAETVVNIDNGTRYFLRRMLVEGVMQGMSVDVLTDKIQSELFGLPVEEAGKLNESRIRSIVTTEINRADSLGRLGQMKAMGLKLKRWITRLVDVCIVCIANERYGSVPLDFEYEDVFGPTLTPPGHPVTCHCSLGADAEELNKMGTVEYWDGGATKEKADFFPSQSTKQSELPFVIVQNGDGKPPEPVFTSEKFNPHHEPAGSPKGGQFTFAPTGSFNPALGDEYWSEGGRFGLGFEGFSDRNINSVGKFTMEDGTVVFVKEINFSGFGDERTLRNITEHEKERDRELLARALVEEMGTEDTILQVWDISRDDDVVIATEWVDGDSLFTMSAIRVDEAFARLTDEEYTNLLVTEAIIGNGDRHMGNVFITDSREILLIDNGRAFSDIGFEGPDDKRVVFDELELNGHKQLDMEAMEWFADGENVASLSDFVENTNVLDNFELDSFNSRLTSMSRVAQIAVSSGGMTGNDFFELQGDEELLLTTWLSVPDEDE